MNKINGNDYDKNMQSDIALCYERKKKKKIQLAIDEFHWGQVWVCSLLSLSVFLE